ncbi:MAG TPA: DUF4147 domain-containing protein, partial [Longilinea sp.]|nr:DUF4147 domain-containing protein [Longilinea sp.]
SDSFPPQIQLLTGGHPIPDESSQEAGKAIHQLLLNKSSDEIVIALISGGASALVVYPEKDVTLADYRKLTQLLLSCGATIGEINCLRKHIDGFKGGGLLRWAAPSPIISLILSDVVNNPLDVIASGPTVPDPTTFQDARKIIEKYDLSLKIPVSIHNLIDQGINKDIQETVKPDDPINNNSLIHLIGSNQIAAEAAQKAAKENGILARILTTSLVGEAGIAGEWLVEMLKKEINSGVQRPFCLIAGGETVVTLKGNGSGGRNLETALAAVRGLDGLSNVALITLATDGEDGPTDAAGAIVTGMTLASSLKNGINPDEYLKNNDSYHFWLNTGGMLQIGSTGTNVNDLAFLFAF